MLRDSFLIRNVHGVYAYGLTLIITEDDRVVNDFKHITGMDEATRILNNYRNRFTELVNRYDVNKIPTT